MTICNFPLSYYADKIEQTMNELLSMNDPLGFQWKRSFVYSNLQIKLEL